MGQAYKNGGTVKKDNRIQGGILAPQGYIAAGVSCGIKKEAGRNDLALIVSKTKASAAGVFTKNAVKAACVLCSQKNIEGGVAQAIVVNAGNANACNGKRGLADAQKMIQLAAERVGVSPKHVLNASTGIIGHLLPMEKIEKGIKAAAAALHDGACDDVISAIITTDTFPKQIAVEIMIDRKPVRIGGIAKGAGMIEPNMATMLSFMTSDAAIKPAVLKQLLRNVVKTTFNAITVDGDTSTNDMCLLLANGSAGNKPITNASSPAAKKFEDALHDVCLFLAKEIARDGEGATKLVEITVKNVAQPQKVAKTIANSPLVKTALYGNDPNWGRIIAAAGRSGVSFDPAKVDISLAGTAVFKHGAGVEFDAAALSEKMKAKEVRIVVDFHQRGKASAVVWTCDFSYDYVKINADYHT